MLDTILLILILIFSIAAFLQAWLAKMMVVDLRDRIRSRLCPKIDQVHLMNYNMLLKDGISREDLSFVYPEIARFDE